MRRVDPPACDEDDARRRRLRQSLMRFAASWPQAASMSRPRVRRTVAPHAVLLQRGLEGGDRLRGSSRRTSRSGCTG